MTSKRPLEPPLDAAVARRRERRLKLVLSAFSAALALALAEVAVRVLAPQTALAGLDFLVADGEVGWRLAPGVDRVMDNESEFHVRVRTDARGFRVGDEPPSSRPPLLALGDSYVFGWGVEAGETLFARAGAVLDLPVVNSGVPGYVPCQAARLGEQVIDALRPRLVTITIFLGNDERESALETVYEIRDGGLAPPGWRPGPLRPLLHPLFQSSHLLRLLRFSPPARWLERRFVGQPRDYAAALSDILLALREGPPPEIVAGDAAIARCLPVLRDDLAARGVPLLAVLLPDWTQVDPARLESDAAVIGASGLDPSAPARRLSALLDAAGIDFVDLRPALAAAIARGETIYFDFDRHLTPLGHRRAAEALFGPLRELLAQATAPGPTP